jgi:hypothetical protein
MRPRPTCRLVVQGPRICGVTEYAEQHERQALGRGSGSATASHIRLASE